MRTNGEDIPVSDSNGIFGFEYILDDKGRPAAIHFLGMDTTKTYAAGKRYVYDEYGNITHCEYFDENGNLCDNEQGWAVTENKSNRYGNIECVIFYHSNNRPCSFPARSIIKYDNRGNKTEEAYWGIDGKPCTESKYSIYAKATYKYDSNRNKMEEAYWGVDGKPCNSIYAKATYKYDNRGKNTETAYWDIDGKTYQGRRI